MKTKKITEPKTANNEKSNVIGGNFSVFAMQTIDKKNGGYKHIIQDKTLYIAKDGVTMELTDDEVMKLLKALGIATSDFRSGFKFGI